MTTHTSAGGDSQEIGLFRAYPFNVETEAHVWDVVNLEIEKDSDSHRPEDYKIMRSHDWLDQSDRVQSEAKIKKPEAKYQMLRLFADRLERQAGNMDPVDYLNGCRRSIGIVRPRVLEGETVLNDNPRHGVQGILWTYQQWVESQDNFPRIPKLRWQSHTGKWHDAKIVAQEIFMGLKRNVNIWDATRLYDSEYAKFLVIGNMKHHPNAFAWRDDEQERRRQAEDGSTVVANESKDQNLIQWADKNGRLVSIGRGTPFGNPFVLNDDGTRDEVCDAYRDHYLPFKPSIKSRLGELAGGKVLLCFCHPERCHGHQLAKIANKKP